MARIISNFFIALDGVVERPDQWHFPYFDDAMGKVVGDGMATQSSFLMGRRLYDEWSEFWPQQGPEVPFSTHINEMPKYGLSHTPAEAQWQNTTIISGPDDASVAAAVRQLKADVEGDIGMSGS